MLRQGTKEVIMSSSGDITIAPPTWVIIDSFTTKWSGNIFENLKRWHSTFRRTESSDDTALLKAIMYRKEILIRPHDFFDIK
jgi:hypothetical protein